MAIILNIDTSTENASLCLSKDGQVLAIKKNDQQKDHASWLHPVIEETIIESKMPLSEVDAIAVTIGPGSYTGLRVGLAAAKGICFALEKPLLTISTLLVMANAVKNESADLFCPMIDARRMEVFAALYTNELKEIISPMAMILDEKSFAEILISKKILFSGNGSEKYKKIAITKNAMFSNSVMDVSHMSSISETLFLKKQFSDLAYAEPQYLKEFHIPVH